MRCVRASEPRRAHHSPARTSGHEGQGTGSASHIVSIFVTFDPWPDAEVHVEWGEIGAREAGVRGNTVVVVDVLSFSTTVTMTVERGGRVMALGRGETAPVDTYALAKDRRDADARLTLSPASTARVRRGDRLALWSANGAAVVAACRDAPTVLVACFRNRTAAAAACAAAARVTVVACAERWSSVGIGHGVRPCLEDWLGAGAIVNALEGRTRSPEAEAAATTFEHGRDRITQWLQTCTSGRELIAKGFPDDVDFAAQLDVSDVVPRLARDGFFDATSSPS
jgi:2-phosphosulfolactate phosphatase